MDRSTPYDLANPKHRRELDAMTVETLIDIFGEPTQTAEWDTPTLHHWQPGQPRPLFANDDPAVMQAIGRCATARIWDSLPSDRQPRRLGIVVTNAHPAECEFCDLPIDELLAACDWATFEGRTQTGAWLTWSRQRDGQVVAYRRRVPSDGRNERHARFWALPSPQRAELIRRAQYPNEAAA